MPRTRMSTPLTADQELLLRKLIELSNCGAQLPEELQEDLCIYIHEANTMERFYSLIAAWVRRQRNPRAILAALR